jgi:hypothetical protein
MRGYRAGRRDRRTRPSYSCTAQGRVGALRPCGAAQETGERLQEPHSVFLFSEQQVRLDVKTLFGCGLAWLGGLGFAASGHQGGRQAPAD